LIKQGKTFYSQEEYERAIEAFEQAIELFPAYGSYKLLIGDMLFKLRRIEAATQAYRETIEFVPEHDQAWSGLGQCMMLLGKDQEARDAFERAVELASDAPEPLYYGAMVYAKLNDHAKAQTFLRRALALRPDWKKAARQDPLLKDCF
jgi:tetratricopeptide (TPR) repeat protein